MRRSSNNHLQHHHHRSDRGSHSQTSSRRNGYLHHPPASPSFHGGSVHSSSRVSATALSKTATVLERPETVPNTYKKLSIELPRGLFSGPNLGDPSKNHPILFIPPFTGPTCPPPHNSKAVRTWRGLPSYPVERSTSKCLPMGYNSNNNATTVNANRAEPNRDENGFARNAQSAPPINSEQQQSFSSNNRIIVNRSQPLTGSLPVHDVVGGNTDLAVADTRFDTDIKSAPETAQSAANNAEVIPPIGSPEFNSLSKRKKKAFLREDQFDFYCEPCQKGFWSEEKYDEHVSQHIYCSTPGCNFTCRSDKEDKMKEHVEYVHLRPNPPNMKNKEEYLEQRRRRYPTSENISATVEELCYKLMHGEQLEPERRRWFDQQLKLPENRKYAEQLEEHIKGGGRIAQNPGAGSNPNRKRGRDTESSEHSGDETESLPKSAVSADENGAKDEEASHPSPTAHGVNAGVAPEPPEEDPFEAMIAMARASGNEQMLKLALMAKQQRDIQNNMPGTISNSSGQKSSSAALHSNQNEEDEEQQGAPSPQSARRNAEEDRNARLITKVVAPVAAAKRARLSRAEQAAARKAAGEDGSLPNHPVAERASDRHRGLFERLTQDNRVDDMSLVLQALRFFVNTDFLQE